MSQSEALKRMRLQMTKEDLEALNQSNQQVSALLGQIGSGSGTPPAGSSSPKPAITPRYRR